MECSCLLTIFFYCEQLESHMPRLALSATQSLPPPTLAGCHVLSSPHKLNGESENPVQPMLNIWRLGRGAGLKLGKLLWHSCPHERQPSTPASSGSFRTTRADNWGSGWDHKSSKAGPWGPGHSKGRDSERGAQEDHRTVMVLILCLLANFLQLWSQICLRTLNTRLLLGLGETLSWQQFRLPGLTSNLVMNVLGGTQKIFSPSSLPSLSLPSFLPFLWFSSFSFKRISFWGFFLPASWEELGSRVFVSSQAMSLTPLWPHRPDFDVVPRHP